jgi:hypothetical protein
MHRSQFHYAFAIALGAVLAACGRDRASHDRPATTPRLRTDAASACDAGRIQLVLELPAAGGIWLNKEPFDSTSLVRWLRDGLARRDPAGRLVFVRADSLRARELGWLIPAIERGGGGAYEPDTACIRPIRAPSLAAPAA